MYKTKCKFYFFIKGVKVTSKTRLHFPLASCKTSTMALVQILQENEN